MVAIRAVTAIRSAITACHETLRRYPQLHARVQPLLDLHRTHLASLEHAIPKEAGRPGRFHTYVAARTPKRALRRLTAVETALQSAMAQQAMAALNGELALLLASMSAAVGQRLPGLGGSSGQPT